jgi:hypothetical protein
LSPKVLVRMSDEIVAVLSQAEVCARPEDGEQPPVAVRECRPRVLRAHSPGTGGAHGGHAAPCSARSVYTGNIMDLYGLKKTKKTIPISFADPRAEEPKFNCLS